MEISGEAVGFMPRIVVNILSHNELIYLQNLIPTVAKFADKIVVVDDESTDGTLEFLKCWPIVEVVHRKFDLNFSNQRNAGLEVCDVGDWIFRIDADEVPSDTIVNDIRGILTYFDKIRVNRVAVPIFHMTSFSMCKRNMGVEIRLFKKVDFCLYVHNTHEEIHADFGDLTQVNLPQETCLIHFKYFDKNRIKYTEEFFIPNALYDPQDWRERVEAQSTFIPPFVHYSINSTLREYLCTNNS